MARNKIVITGGPSTGKTSLIDYLQKQGEYCLHEISRQITKEAQENGITQLFLQDPTLFSKKLLEGRIKQYKEANQLEINRVFIDRGIPDILAYMSYANQSSPEEFIDACKKYTYQKIFVLPPWEDIHVNDEERYESFEQSQDIYKHLISTYEKFGYDCIEVPFDNVEERCKFIVDNV